MLERAVEISEALIERGAAPLRSDSRHRPSVAWPSSVARTERRAASLDVHDGDIGTVDVVEDGDDRCLVLYSTEISPDDLADVIGPAVEAGVRGLKEHLVR